MPEPTFTFLEFFAGAGMARLGLGADWKCLLANDIDRTKAAAYSSNFSPADELVLGDVGKLSANSITEDADLAWASFPCQDLSLAGNGAGLKGGRSGTFWSFWRIIAQLNEQERAPSVVALENVYGTLTSNRGRDFASIVGALVEEGYSVGAMVIDAVHFLPQSRPRLFIVGVHESANVPEELVSAAPVNAWHSQAVVAAFESLPSNLKQKWIWWKVPMPRGARKSLSEIIEENPSGVEWNSEEKTAQLLAMMSPLNAAKVKDAMKSGQRQVGTIYRRTRVAPTGEKIQRAEVRFDGIAGCLRTPGGGSSRQTLLVVEGRSVRSRLLSPREVARLMGLPDKYKLPSNYNAAYHLAGDGVAVPVVRHLARNLFKPLLTRSLMAVG
ncbi:MAG: DNA cytosine methyltransferase [Gemmatimonadaceae bacterium]|nr:DNA cytosine methyltransferase [Gemmatimonadaceae bacterium]MCW5827579.1 DNA cytosine methyltransferase [Gemmatimonadaceae bacterium]